LLDEKVVTKTHMFWVAGCGEAEHSKTLGLSLFLLPHRETTVACGWSRFPRFSSFWRERGSWEIKTRTIS